MLFSKTAIARCSQPNCGCRINSFVWVSHSQRIIWYEVPKAASTSIKTALNILGAGANNKFEFVNVDCTPLEAAEEYSDYFKFAVVRDPWDKMVSLWHMFCRQNNDFRNTQIETLFGLSRREIEFPRFIKLTEKFANHHWEKTVNFLPISTINRIHLDVVVRLDAFEKGMIEVDKQFSQFNLPTKRLNSTEHRHYSTYFDDETKQKVERMFAIDINTIGFDFHDQR